jgi:hypothetical protein
MNPGRTCNWKTGKSKAFLVAKAPIFSMVKINLMACSETLDVVVAKMPTFL